MKDFFSKKSSSSKKQKADATKKEEDDSPPLPSLKSSISISDAPKVINVLYGLGDKNKKDNIATCEGRVIALELPQVYIVNAYVPNSGQKLQRLDYRLNTWDISFGIVHAECLKITECVTDLDTFLREVPNTIDLLLHL